MKINKKHVNTYFLDWLEGKLDDEQQEFVNGHLDQCVSCKFYYQTMQSVIENPDSESLPTLKKDPYLPVRIKQMAADNVEKEQEPVPIFGLSRSLTGTLAVLGLLLGMLMGQLLVYNSQHNQEVVEETSITELYYDGIVQPNLGSNFEHVLTEMEGDQQ